VFSSRLQRAIGRGLKPNGNLADELGELGDYSIRSRNDAKAICKALSEFPQDSAGEGFRSPLHALTALFQDVESRDCPAFEVLYSDGQAQLMRILDEKLADANEDRADDLLFILKILAMYGSREGAEKVVEAARRPLKPDAFMWAPIFSSFAPGHPHAEYVFDAIGESLPNEFLAVALLDSANSMAIEHGLQRHPFDSSAGVAKLESWLKNPDPETFSYAHSATAALPFIGHPSRDGLLALAMDHLSPSVQMEAAWAAAKLDREAGLKLLARFCLEVDHSDVAQRYLTELGRNDLIPSEASDPSFQAKAEFSRWLAHPNELGRPPDELEIVDHRQLAWPPEHELRPFWLIRYLLRDRTGLEGDDVDCGLVGSMTWCFFSYSMNQRPPEDIYAIHCYWEMQHAGLIEETEVTDATEYASFLGQWRGKPLEQATITRIVEVSPKLRTDNRLMALAAGRVNDQEGWVVLDGPHSTWYPADEQPSGGHESILLMIHVGRQLLGFIGSPDRKKYIGNSQGPDPERFIAAYERLIEEAADAEPEQQQELLGSFGLLARHFEAYVDRKSSSAEEGCQQIAIDTYRQFLNIARNVDPAIADKVLRSTSLVGKMFNEYVEALAGAGETAEIPDLIDFFAPRWENNLGFGILGRAAHTIGQLDQAENYFVKLRDGKETYYRSMEMSTLAEIWHGRGETGRANELLIACLRQLLTEMKESKYASDRKRFAEDFDHHRSTFLRLFPNGESELKQLGIPESPLGE